LRANTAGKSLCRVRPQADSYRGRTMRARSHSVAPRRSSLASERGGHKNDLNRFVRKRTPTGGVQCVHEAIPLPPVGARLRANAVCTEIISTGSSASGLLQGANNACTKPFRCPRSERGGHRTISKDSSASGLLQGANTAGTERFRCPPVGARLRANTAGTEQSQKIRPQADS